MKKAIHPLLAAAVGVCLAQAAFASAPATSTEFKQVQPEQHAKKGKGAKKHAAPKASKQA